MSRPSRNPEGRPSLYNEEIHNKIVEYIAMGTFQWVAAEASGISWGTFNRWMKDAEEKGPKSKYFKLHQDVSKAHAEARAGAEARVYKEKPYEWLRTGPGRVKQDKDGWTERTEIAAPQGSKPLSFIIVPYVAAPQDVPMIEEPKGDVVEGETRVVDSGEEEDVAASCDGGTGQQGTE